MSKSVQSFVPERLYLFEEHSDWADLQRLINSRIILEVLIITCIKQGIYAYVEAHCRFITRSISNELETRDIIHEAIIPVAGLGTKLYLTTHSIKTCGYKNKIINVGKLNSSLFQTKKNVKIDLSAAFFSLINKDIINSIVIDEQMLG